MTKVTLLSIAALSAALAGTPAVSAQETAAPFAFSAVNVVDVRNGQVLSNRTVHIADGRITSITTMAPPAGVRVIDGTGQFLIPGLWDMHVHVRSPLAPTLLFPQFVAHGVTGVRDMASDCDGGNGAACIDSMLVWQSAIDRGELLGPRLLALSSFPLNPPWDYDVTEEMARELVALLDDRGVDLIKTYFRLSPEAFGWFVDEARSRGLHASGHIPLRMTVRQASETGLRSLEHARDFLFDCFPGSSEFRRTTRSQNPPMDVMRSMVDDHDPGQCHETFRTMVANDTWYVPTHVTRRMDAYADDPSFRNDPRSRYIPAQGWAAWQADADRMVALDSTPEGRRVMRGFYEKGLEITGRAFAAGVPIVLGTDAGDTYVFPGSGVHDELGELVKAGLTPAQALAAATIRAAEFLGQTANHGTIDVGKRADVVLLAANPLQDIENVREISAVVIGGQVYDRARLDEMLENVAALVAAMR